MKRFFLCALMALFTFAASAEELNVASFNIRLNSKKDYKKHNGWNERKQYVCDLINLEAFDVFGVQEARKPQLNNMLAMLPDYEYIGVGRDDGKSRGEFCPVFYRKDKFKMLNGGTFWLSETPDEVSRGWDGVCRRICSWGYFQRKSDKMRFYFLCIHLDHKGKEAQMEGSKLVVDWIKRNCKGENAIVVGDFNVTQNSEAYSIFAESGILKDTYEAAKYRFAPTGTFNGFNPNRYTTQRIDHIFVTNNIDVSRYGVLTYRYFRKVDGEEQDMDTAAPKEVKGKDYEIKNPSDHYPIQSWITLNKGAKKAKKSKK